jgi:2-amino-4-hydroxy-6-hydroxymethyldihydropteridine diphosphokinase
MISEVFIALGSNLGDRSRHLGDAILHIKDEIGAIERLSSVYETEPMGFKAVQNFFNQVIQVRTSISPIKVMEKLLQIERKLGRERSENEGYESRNIDLDLLFYGNLIIEEPGLTVPHPGIPYRRFVLLPLTEIAPDFLHPVLQKSIAQINGECDDDLNLKRIE